jgi:hypothetical protein
LVDPLRELYDDVDQERLRVQRPTKLVFLCGGRIQEGDPTTATSLRDYLFRLRKIPDRLRAEVVLAERATKLYRDTQYHDLISFEEDIARIAAVVLVIVESPGSLAELGAFASNDVIRDALRIMMQKKYSTEESFIRFGPVERIKKVSMEYVGFYPWRLRKSGTLIIRSVKPHFSEMLKFVRHHISSAPASMNFSSLGEAKIIYIIYWIVYLAMAISITSLQQIVDYIYPGIGLVDIKNKLFCLRFAGWIDSEDYSGKEYFFACYDKDPFRYGFKTGVQETDSVRRKIAVSVALQDFEKAPKYIRATAVARRSRL